MSRVNLRGVCFVVVLAAVLLAPAARTQAQGGPDFAAAIDPEDVMVHVRALSVAIGARPPGSEAEARAADYVAVTLRDWGYAVEIQTFETRPAGGGERVLSRNVIATGPGGDRLVIAGAHLDSVEAGTGAGDNASGVAALLAAAKALRDVELAHTLVFVAFGAEERGDPSGAQVYVDHLGARAADVIAMLNIDSVGVGDALYVYAGAPVSWPGGPNAAPEIGTGPVWVRDLALDLAAGLGLPFQTSPPETWGGYTGDWSDHYAFVEAGIPVAYFEAWRWDGAPNPWWGQETADGDIMHTAGDVYEAVKPVQVEQVAELVAATLAAIASGAAGPP